LKWKEKKSKKEINDSGSWLAKKKREPVWSTVYDECYKVRAAVTKVLPCSLSQRINDQKIQEIINKKKEEKENRDKKESKE